MIVGERGLEVIRTLAEAARLERNMQKRRLDEAQARLFALLWAAEEAIQHSGGKDPEQHLGDTPAAKDILKMAKKEMVGCHE